MNDLFPGDLPEQQRALSIKWLITGRLHDSLTRSDLACSRVPGADANQFSLAHVPKYWR
jgi:hypothetical protein